MAAAASPNKPKLVECIWDHIHPTDHITAFDVTKRVAWALRGEGAGLLIKNGGENIAAWQGNLFAASRIVYPDGHLFKVIFDAGPGGANGPSWQDEGDYRRCEVFTCRRSIRAFRNADSGFGLWASALVRA